MRNLFTRPLLAVISLGFIGVLAFAPAAGAVNITEDGSVDAGNKALTNDGNDTDTVPEMAKRIISTLLFILGIAAVIVIILAGIRYATANGDSGTLQTAKNTILYAVIGLIVAIMAFAIVNFVLGSFKSS